MKFKLFKNILENGRSGDRFTHNWTPKNSMASQSRLTQRRNIQFKFRRVCWILHQEGFACWCLPSFHPSIGHYEFCIFNLGRKSLLSFKCSAKLQADLVFLWQNFLNIQIIFFSSAFVGILLSQFWLLDGLHWTVGMVYWPLLTLSKKVVRIYSRNLN